MQGYSQSKPFPSTSFPIVSQALPWVCDTELGPQILPVSDFPPHITVLGSRHPQLLCSSFLHATIDSLVFLVASHPALRLGNLLFSERLNVRRRYKGNAHRLATCG